MHQLQRGGGDRMRSSLNISPEIRPFFSSRQMPPAIVPARRGRSLAASPDASRSGPDYEPKSLVSRDARVPIFFAKSAQICAMFCRMGRFQPESQMETMMGWRPELCCAQ
ncbi:hypothetical protein RA27_08345 [Ruegeria sp. ANG-R]|nr:hypothetical protein RA27_08345 [Ruegeria sp. ANG-R]